jgi:3-oxoacyl-[acyl-carrier-protein] synthase III
MPFARIVGTGMYVPDRIVTNEELGQWMDTSPEWILQRTGIEQRRWVTESTGVSDLAIPAAQMAMDEAGWSKPDVDIVLFATLSADMMFPGTVAHSDNRSTRLTRQPHHTGFYHQGRAFGTIRRHRHIHTRTQLRQ